jgi:hypothetical protein
MYGITKDKPTKLIEIVFFMIFPDCACDPAHENKIRKTAKGMRSRWGKAHALPELEHRHPAVFPTWLFRPVSGLASFGSSPSRDNHSGILMNPRLLTVAGAAQVFHLFPVSPRRWTAMSAPDNFCHFICNEFPRPARCCNTFNKYR